MKPPSAPSIFSIAACHALLVTLSCSSAHALNWDGLATGAGASDGGANWNAGNVWWNGTSSGAWVDGSSAVFGAGGMAGTVNLQGQTYNVSGLTFNAVDLTDVTDPPPTVVHPAYTLSNGRTNIASGGSISIAATATGPDPSDRIKLNQIIGGHDVTITHTGGSVFYQLGGSNQWTGNLTLDATNGNNSQFVEIKAPNAISTLGKITVESGNTLAMAASGTFTGPEIEIRGTGANSRGAFRIDANATINNNITLAANARISTINDGVVTTLGGNITGAFLLDQNSSGTVGTLIYAGTNTISELSATKGNAQIGVGSVGSITGNVTAGGTAAMVTGTGTINGNLNVTTGVVKPGDHTGTGIAGAGTGLGTLNVNGNASLNLTAAGTAAEFQMGLASSDRLAVTGNLTLSGTTTIVGLFAAGYTPTEGNTWNLITYGGTLTQGSFDLGANMRTGADSVGNEGNLNLPDVSANGLVWDVALTNGALTATLAVIPEPSAALLFGASTTLLTLRRRRKSGCGE
ncbi:PEP-CTERM sorting domain-containing protein [Luteolibacter sp. SL250]|uniref:PEP-CTERM sorting domain-containing protein n=1 Tax=Luteolibacter sp. SL250 TaxID=2995170 RepID=UPI0022701D9F|nr:PEP-CTERM sorting domain-containing protein [Luteolibacter sp. SL250]WAC17777.1 PEP-CTERM sorting domain-containing protein [Luteolibacter sp. SL250]